MASDLSPDPPPPPADHRRSEEAAAQVASRKKRHRRILLVAASVLLGGLLVAELGARVRGFKPVTRLVAAGERGWAMKPGVHDVQGAPLTISDSGTRGPEAAGGILILGDEFALGPGLPDAESLAPAVAARTSLPVTLAACDGYDTVQERIWLEELAPRLKPRLVIFVMSPDDTRPFASTLFTRIRFNCQSFSALAAGMFPAAPAATRADLVELYAPDGIPWRFWEGEIGRIGKWSRENKTPVVWVVRPLWVKQDDGLREYFEQVRGKAREEGLIPEDLLAAFAGEDLAKLTAKERMKRTADVLAEVATDILK